MLIEKLTLAIFGLALCAAACGSSSVAAEPPSPPFAQAVDIGNGRSLFLEARGSGGPTVVLISGLGTDASDWSMVLDPADPVQSTAGDDVGAGLGDLHASDEAVFPSVARFTRVCAYDRPDTRLEGADLSTPAAQPHTLERDVADLHALLTAAHLPEPYVLVPHSYGGLIATLYARLHPSSVAGVVMVDAATELLADVLGADRLAYWDATKRATSVQVREGVEIIDGFRRINAAPPMQKVPTIVLSADRPYRVDLFPGDARDLTFADWLAAQDLLASQRAAAHITQTRSGHHVYLYRPGLVVDAIRKVVDEVRAR